MGNEELKKILDSSDNIVFFGGAGVSTESGISDFRSADGIYVRDEALSPEEILSHTFFMQHPEDFFDYYKKNLVSVNAKPNPAHFALAKLEEQGKLRAIVTQNIDGLHQAAGSKRVYELHGSVHRNRCMRCDTPYPLDAVMNADGVPRCPKCGGIIKPDVVLYEEMLNSETMTAAAEYISYAETLIIGGTSLAVFPAAAFIKYFAGKYLIIINKTPTKYDDKATLAIHEPIGKVLGECVMGNV